MRLNCGVGKDSWEFLGLQRDQTSQSKGNQPWIFIGRTDAEAETPILWPPDAKNWLTWKDPDAGKDWRREEKGTTEDEMVGWHHRLHGHEQAPGIGDGQENLACCSPWGRKESDRNERLNWTNWILMDKVVGGAYREILFAGWRWSFLEVVPEGRSRLNWKTSDWTLKVSGSQGEEFD